MNNFYMTNNWKDIPVQDWHKAYIELLKENQKLDLALDIACEMLSMNEESVTLDSSYHDKDQWKEWLMKDE